ncbi:MAG: YihA family ribosome biogenesis GTP-binding protein [Geminicoccaceae bacterium]|nr:MAG: YihA family ribosome biogenesis GTP-binding protein [Geminicoccaceae bacterium]
MSEPAVDAFDTPERLERGRWLFAQPCTFLRGVVAVDQLPPFALPEVAFAGRSNVGKSSLINALTGRKTLARTSNTPGRTQEVNFFDLAGELILVDLPGYGFAKAPKAKVDAWVELIKAYLAGRPTLRLACVLVDARHGLKESDREVMQLLGKAAVPFLVVFTKADLIKPPALAKLLATSEAELRRTAAALPTPAATSSAKGAGIDHLRARLAMLTERADEGPKG